MDLRNMQPGHMAILGGTGILGRTNTVTRRWRNNDDGMNTSADTSLSQAAQEGGVLGACRGGEMWERLHRGFARDTSCVCLFRAEQK
jgi:hypothetical protein